VNDCYDSLAGRSKSWKSLLYVPVLVEKYLDKALNSGAEAIILDLEDSVPLANKDKAREKLSDTINKLKGYDISLFVRVNAPWRLMIRDLEAAVLSGVTAIMCPKIKSAWHVKEISNVIHQLESERGITPGTIGLVAIVEDPESYFNLEQIAVADPRILWVSLGTEDLAAELGVDPSDEKGGLKYAKFQTVMANKKAGLEPVGLVSSMANFRDLERLKIIAEDSKKMGFVGATCIHPSQVPVINKAFSPSEEERKWALRVKNLFEESLSKGSASVSMDGSMIDTPVYKRAKNIIARSCIHQ